MMFWIGRGVLCSSIQVSGSTVCNVEKRERGGTGKEDLACAQSNTRNVVRAGLFGRDNGVRGGTQSKGTEDKSMLARE